MIIEFTQQDRQFVKGTRIEVHEPVAREYIKRGVAEAVDTDANEIPEKTKGKQKNK